MITHWFVDQSSVAQVHEFLMAMNNDKRMTRRIAHLHGRFDFSDRIILSIEDYRRAYGLNPITGKSNEEHESKLRFRLLWAVLATRRAVFVGFSMNDPYLNEMLDAVSADLWRWGKSIRYAIMSISPEDANQLKGRAERLKRDYGVATIFYEDFDNAHQGLDHIVAEMTECHAVEIQQPIDDWDLLEQMSQHMDRKLENEN